MSALVLDPRDDPDLELGVRDAAPTPHGVLFTVEGAVGIVRPDASIDRYAVDAGLTEPAIADVHADVALISALDRSLLLGLSELRVRWRGPGGRCAALSPDAARVLIGGHEGTRLFDVTREGPVARFTGHSSSVCSVAFTDHGLRSGGDDGRVLELCDDGDVAGVLADHPRAARWLLDAGRISAGRDGSVEVIGRDRALVAVPAIEPRSPVISISTGGPAYHARFSPDGSVVAVGEHHTGRYDPASGALLAATERVGHIALSPVAGKIAMRTSEGLFILEPGTLAARPMFSDWASPRQFFLDDDYLMTANSSEGLVLDVRTGEQRLALGAGAGFWIASLPRTRSLITTPAPVGVLVVDHSDAVRVERRWDDASLPVPSPDGRRAFFFGAPGLQLVDLDDHRELLVVAGTTARNGAAAWASEAPLGAYAVGPNVRCCDYEGRTVAEVPSPLSESAWSLAISPQGGHVAGGTLWADQAFVWDVASGRTRRLASGGEGSVRTRWLGEDRLLVSVRDDNRDQCYLHDARGELVAKLTGFRRPNRALGSPVFPGSLLVGGLVVVFVCDDGVLRAFDRTSGDLVFEAEATEGQLRDVDLAPDARRLLAVDSAGAVRIYDLPSTGQRLP